MNDPNLNKDFTEEWESEFERRKGPKLKVPIKATAENIDSFSIDFPDPKIKENKKKEEKGDKGPRIIDLSGKNKKKDKKKLF